MDTKFTTKVTAGLSVLTLALMGVVGTTSAYAQETTPPDLTNNGPASISSITDEATPGSITITKLTPSSEKQEAGNGTKLANNPAGSKGIKNVKFTAAKVEGIDLKTNEGWQKAAAVMKGAIDNADQPTKVTVDSADYALSATDRKDGRTQDDGTLKLADLPVGLYLVWETVDQDVRIDGDTEDTEKDRITKAKPFFVSVPMTNPNNHTEWMYDIFVYPKNSLAGKPTKTVDDDKAGVGSGNDNSAEQKSEITYTLSADIPNIPTIEGFNLIDKFTTDQLEWIGADTDTVKIYDGDTEAATLDKDTDFRFSDVKTDGDYSFIAVEIINPNTTLASYKGKKLKWTMHAKVKDTAGATKVPNTPYLHEGPDGWSTTDPGTPGPEVKSYYGKVKINKKGADDTPLAGAKFVLYECSADGFTDPANGKEIPGSWELKEENRVSVDGKKEWVSADNTGVIEIDGLLVNDFRNNSKFINGKDGDEWVAKSWYCLKETQAPDGYELLPNPIKFQITSNKGEADPKDMVMDVHNQKTPELPVTGGAGMAMLVGAGVLLLAGSGVYAFAYNRKRKLNH